MSDARDGAEALPGNRRRRYLAILFSDLSHSVSIASAMETEDYADLLSRLRRRSKTSSSSMAERS